ncbi:hypothetical protein HYDPIDRAFT_112092 [Hydnomerulius pinastri MD-312]|uniref:Tetratricopeptide repeat protein 39B n=1 Tax=Hydnomerulius pinastri MD-312 TaxID=994086 RepID=A0A0C9W936_9AGAM|nr:hypothetical protein HYDPIDRAFT_112092 [Hydnomerulius pinastri MD-312]
MTHLQRPDCASDLSTAPSPSTPAMNRPAPSLPAAYDPVNALDDIPGIHWALHEFLHSRMLESEEYCHRVDPNKERLYFATGYALIQCVKGLMSFEDKDLLSAINHTKHGNSIAAAHRKRAPSLAGRLASYIVPGLSTSGPEWIAQMTPVERHAELVYAESLYEKSLLGIVYSGDWLAFIKEVLNMRTTMSIYRQLGRYIETADAAYAAAHPASAQATSTTVSSEAASFTSAASTPTTSTPASFSSSPGVSDPASAIAPLEDPSIDQHFRSGVYLGVGMSNLVLSMMPGRLLAIVELFGYHGDRKEGLRLLNRAGGWGADGARSVVTQESEGVRRAICDMTLLIFHLVLSAYTFEGVDVALARRVVEWNLERYPNGVFFLFGAGRLALARSQPQRALEFYAQAAQAQSQYRNMHHISWWESAIANLALWNVAASKEWWSRLGAEATWSKATYAYGEAACLATLGEHAAAAKLMEKVSGLRQRIAGKSIPVEKFAARKARKYLSQKNRLLLPALELAYVFTAVAHAPRQIILDRMIPDVRNALKELGVQEESSSVHGSTPNGVEGKNTKGKKGVEKNDKAKAGVEGREGYWDDVCLARFLEGVCWRFVAYPDPDAELEADEKLTVPVEDARQKAEGAFKAVFENGPRIELDHYLVYYAHFEYGRLLARSGDKDGAKSQFDMVLSGKTLEINAAGRKGKYSLENALHVRTHAAVEALGQDRLL